MAPTATYKRYGIYHNGRVYLSLEITIDIFVINTIIQDIYVFLPIGNILQYIQNFIVKYVCTLPEGAMIRELCLQRDNDDLILSNSELSILIDDLCVN